MREDRCSPQQRHGHLGTVFVWPIMENRFWREGASGRPRKPRHKKPHFCGHCISTGVLIYGRRTVWGTNKATSSFEEACLKTKVWRSHPLLTPWVLSPIVYKIWPPRGRGSVFCPSPLKPQVTSSGLLVWKVMVAFHCSQAQFPNPRLVLCEQSWVHSALLPSPHTYHDLYSHHTCVIPHPTSFFPLLRKAPFSEQSLLPLAVQSLHVLADLTPKRLL